MYTKNEYELVSLTWKEEEGFEADYETAEYFDTYSEACKAAKKMSYKFDRVDIKLNEKNMEDEYTCFDQEPVWQESFEEGKQVPTVYIGERPIWRWDFLDRDLKPRKR